MTFDLMLAISKHLLLILILLGEMPFGEKGVTGGCLIGRVGWLMLIKAGETAGFATYLLVLWLMDVMESLLLVKVR